MSPDKTQPLLHSQQQSLARNVGLGQYVLVNSGENVGGFSRVYIGVPGVLCSYAVQRESVHVREPVHVMSCHM
jgi:hypothetical protein